MMREKVLPVRLLELLLRQGAHVTLPVSDLPNGGAASSSTSAAAAKEVTQSPVVLAPPHWQVSPRAGAQQVVAPRYVWDCMAPVPGFQWPPDGGGAAPAPPAAHGGKRQTAGATSGSAAVPLPAAAAGDDEEEEESHDEEEEEEEEERAVVLGIGAEDVNDRWALTLGWLLCHELNSVRERRAGARGAEAKRLWVTEGEAEFHGRIERVSAKVRRGGGGHPGSSRGQARNGRRQSAGMTPLASARFFVCAGAQGLHPGAGPLDAHARVPARDAHRHRAAPGQVRR